MLFFSNKNISQSVRRSVSRTHIHGSDVIVVRLAHFLHDLLFCQAARFDGALHCDGPLRVIKGQILQSVKRDIHTFITWRQYSIGLNHLIGGIVSLLFMSHALTVKWWSLCPCLVPPSSGSDPLCQSNGRQSCCEREPSEEPHQHYRKWKIY